MVEIDKKGSFYLGYEFDWGLAAKLRLIRKKSSNMMLAI